MFNASITNELLIWASSGASVAKDGDRLTSINQGLYTLWILLSLLKIRVNEDIEAKEFKAICVLLKAESLEVVNNHRIDG